MIRGRRLAAAAFLGLVSIQAAFAAPSPFGIATPDSAGAVSWAGPFHGFFVWIAAQQSAFYRDLTRALSELTQGGHAAVILIGLSFAYGIFHAAGPGHGKAVIASYLLATGDRLKRGVVISFASAFVQALTAIVVVSVGTILLNVTAMTMTRATDALEIASYALIALCGVWLLWTKAVGRRPARPVPATQGTARVFTAESSFAAPSRFQRHGPDCGHGLQFAASGTAASTTAFACDCGQSHAADPATLDRPLTLAGAWSAILAVGIRPCSGAIIVLVFALSQQLYWAGLLSVLTMALGTGLTVSALAVLAVKARDVALRFSEGGSATVARIVHGLQLAAALAILLFGLTMLGGAIAAG